MWKYFHLYAPPSEQKYDAPDMLCSVGNRHACCNICGSNIINFQGKRKSSTTGPIATHLRNVHKIVDDRSVFNKFRLKSSMSIDESISKMSGPKFTM